MENLQRFIKIGEDRIDATEIVRYGLGTDDDGDNFFYLETKTSEDFFSYYDEELDSDVEEKLEEWDKIFLIEKSEQVEFPKRFMKIGDDRINVEEINRYGLDVDDDNDNFLYFELKTENSFEYYEDDVDFELEEKLSELDGIFLFEKR